MKVCVLLLASVLLVGCMSSEEYAAAQEARDNQHCVDSGFEPGSAEYEACRIQLSEDRNLEQYTRATYRTQYGDVTRYGWWRSESSSAWRGGASNWPNTW